MTRQQQPPKMTPAQVGYDAGRRSAAIEMTRLAMRILQESGQLSNNEETALQMIIEREEAIQTLRAVCAEHGDNDWPSSLSLTDIIQKHLAEYLEKA